MVTPHVSRRKKLHGVGVNDWPHIMSSDPIVQGIHKLWVGMLARCYNPLNLEKNPEYVGCVVCEEWHTFSAFYDWACRYYKLGYHLDKDLLHHDNKVYSPTTCCIIPKGLNSTVTERKTRGKGSIYERENGRWRVRYSGTSKTCGSLKEAIATYATLKSERVIAAARMHETPFTDRIVANWSDVDVLVNRYEKFYS